VTFGARYSAARQVSDINLELVQGPILTDGFRLSLRSRLDERACHDVPRISRGRHEFAAIPDRCEGAIGGRPTVRTIFRISLLRDEERLFSDCLPDGFSNRTWFGHLTEP